MEQLVVNGGKALVGDVMIGGAKNAALGIIPAAILSKDVCIIENVPDLLDVRNLLKAMESIGVKIKYINRNKIEIDSREIRKMTAKGQYVEKIRASYYLLGALLGRYGKSEVAYPGGCSIGDRPVDQHLKGFEALGASVKVENGMIKTHASSLTGANIYLDIASVGATINIMLASVLAKGTTIIENPAKEPHVVDIANFLNSMGAHVKGAGTDLIKINGVESMHGSEYMIIPDQIEAGTYMVAAAVTKGDVWVKNIIPKHMEAISAKLVEMGVTVIEDEDNGAIRVIGRDAIKGTHIKTLPYPGFPTDMHPQMAVLMTLAGTNSEIIEGIWPDRFQYANELKKMGAEIRVDNGIARIASNSVLTGAEVISTDLRAGAAMVLAGLCAVGETRVNHVDYIDRGYEIIEDKLRALGADIYRIDLDNPAKQIKAI